MSSNLKIPHTKLVCKQTHTLDTNKNMGQYNKKTGLHDSEFAIIRIFCLSTVHYMATLAVHTLVVQD